MAIALWSEDQLEKGTGENAGCPSIVPFTIKSHKEAAAVIIFPGGGYRVRADHEGEPIAKWLNSIGISAFVVNYRVFPNRHPIPLHDAQRAIRFVRHQAREWGVDPKRIGVLGFSAGGHLAATVSTHFDMGDPEAKDAIERESSRPDLQVLCYPVISFQVNSGSRTSLLGDDPSENLRHDLSNDQQVSDHTPPAFLWHTADDTAVPVTDSLSYCAALSRHHISFELHVYEHGRHGLGLAHEDESIKSWTAHCETWLRRQGF